jgi:ADP-ribose pyrophosphatase YjhB (NUDIX family)
MERRGVTVDVVAVKDNKIALIKRNNEPFKGSYALPAVI